MTSDIQERTLRELGATAECPHGFVAKGSCDRCEMQQEIDRLKAALRTSITYWRDMLSRHNVQGFACDMLEDFDSLVNPARKDQR